MSSGSTAADLFAALRAPFQASDLEWRAIYAAKRKDNQKPFVVCAPYVNRPALINRLNQVCGLGGWATDARVSAGHVYVGVGIRVLQLAPTTMAPTSTETPVAYEWVWRWDGTGFLEAEGEFFSQADAGKGDFSNAFKRACELFGIALYLRELPRLIGIINDNGRYKANLKGGGTCHWDPPGLPDGRPSYPGEIPGFEEGWTPAEGSPPAKEPEKNGPPPEKPKGPKKPAELSDDEKKAEISRCRDRVVSFMRENRLKVYHVDAVVQTHPDLKQRYSSAEELGRIGTVQDWQLLAGLAEKRTSKRWDDAVQLLAEEFPTGAERLQVLDELLNRVKVESEEKLLISSAMAVGWNDAIEYWIEELGKR